MLAILAVFVAAATFLLIEGSLVYYRLPMAPDWLRRSKELQVTLSCLLVNGLVAALFMMGQYLVDLGEKPMRVVDAVLVAAVVAAFVYAWRRIHGLHERLRKAAADAAVVTVIPDSTVERPTLRAA